MLFSGAGMRYSSVLRKKNQSMLHYWNWTSWLLLRVFYGQIHSLKTIMKMLSSASFSRPLKLTTCKLRLNLFKLQKVYIKPWVDKCKNTRPFYSRDSHSSSSVAVCSSYPNWFQSVQLCSTTLRILLWNILKYLIWISTILNSLWTILHVEVRNHRSDI